MACARVPLPGLPWTRGPHPLERKKTSPGSPITLIEFAPGFEDPHWCSRGHAGYVLSGSLELVLEDRGETLTAGEAFSLDPGTRHRARNPGGEPVVLFLASWE
jgi:quercetin dioxygenase-like cupin family protein